MSEESSCGQCLRCRLVAVLTDFLENGEGDPAERWLGAAKTLGVLSGVVDGSVPDRLRGLSMIAMVAGLQEGRQMASAGVGQFSSHHEAGHA